MIELAHAEVRPIVDDRRIVERVLDALSGLDRQRALDVLRRAAATLATTFEVLSARERQVLDLLVQGFNNRGIGDRLGITAKTVDTHRTRVMKKLGAHSLADLIRMATHAGYLP